MLHAEAVLATVKVPNLKANHNMTLLMILQMMAVLATVKVPNLKANHNKLESQGFKGWLC